VFILKINAQEAVSPSKMRRIKPKILIQSTILIPHTNPIILFRRPNLYCHLSTSKLQVELYHKEE
jgi:hypothetical protein